MLDNTTVHLTNINDDSNIVLKRHYEIYNVLPKNLILNNKNIILNKHCY